MPAGIPINGKDFIGYKFNGIEITDVWKGNGGEWRAEVRCSCGEINRMPLRKARGLCACIHPKKRPKHD